MYFFTNCYMEKSEFLVFNSDLGDSQVSEFFKKNITIKNVKADSHPS